MSDVRPPVQEACVDALCQAVTDKHANAVPAGVLMNVLGEIFVPAVMKVGDVGLSKINKELPEDSKLPLANKIQEFLVEAVDRTEVSLSQLPEWISRGSKERNNLESCLSALCACFKLHLKKLSSYPSFDKLWLRMLSTFGYVIEAARNVREIVATGVPATLEFSTEARNCCCIINKMLEPSIEQLRQLLALLEGEDIFGVRPGLLTVSNSTIRQFHGCQHLIR